MRRLVPTALACAAAAAAATGCGGDDRRTTTSAPLSVAQATAGWPGLAAQARRYRRSLSTGDRFVARIAFPRCGTASTVSAGLDQATIDRGPGWYPESALPGEGRLIYLAGHNRTHGGPFGCVWRLRRDDTVTLDLPYATAVYRVVRRGRVHERDVATALRGTGRELLRLQTSLIPPGDRRLIVDLRPVAFAPR